jgi:hypothetical protein
MESARFLESPLDYPLESMFRKKASMPLPRSVAW